ncbi:Hexose transporter protein [Rutstroemia sp. NJR-2017a BBW]|nr:Hexose transporter protein [Rutstroemia sp. NJR-2017a BBW]
MGLVDLGHEADPVLTRIVEEDKVPWYRKRNLRYLYFLLCPTYFGELGVDAVGKETYALKAELLGIVAAAYSLGAILSVPFVPIVAQKFGRRWSIMLGSMIMVLGSILQGFAVHGEQVGELLEKFHLMIF